MKHLILAAIILLIITTPSFGQQQATATANITANVNATIFITRTADLNLDNVNQGCMVTVLSNATGSAAFSVSGAASAQITVTVIFPANLTNGTRSLPFTGQIPRYNTIGGATGRSSATEFGALTGGSATTSSTGELYLWIGGGVTAAALQPAGFYTGVITVSISQP